MMNGSKDKSSAGANASQHWIRPLLSRLDLVSHAEGEKNPAELWDELARTGLLDRLRALPSLINEEAGRHLVHEQWFLPPQRVVCTFTLRKEKLQYGMQLVLRRTGPFLVFYTKKPGTSSRAHSLYRYISGTPAIDVRSRRLLRPAEVSEADLQEWFSYLLSGFEESFQPRAFRASA